MLESSKRVSPLVTEELERAKIVNNSGTLYVRVPKCLKEEHRLVAGDELVYARHIASGRLVIFAPAVPEKKAGE